MEPEEGEERISQLAPDCTWLAMSMSGGIVCVPVLVADGRRGGCAGVVLGVCRRQDRSKGGRLLMSHDGRGKDGNKGASS